MPNQYFAEMFARHYAQGPCQLYLISPPDVGGDFFERLRRALTELMLSSRGTPRIRPSG
jgi:thiamine-phosphate pyrophosphorylase